MHNLGIYLNGSRKALFFCVPLETAIANRDLLLTGCDGRGVIKMAERETTIKINDGEPQQVIIVDNNEGFTKNGQGQIPNHDKVEIVYISPKA